VNLALTYATRLVVLAQGRVALDAPVEEAVHAPDWLTLFSPRLVLSTTPSGRPWVSYS
jgi:ABC-type hemin transport system ATPase subunit